MSIRSSAIEADSHMTVTISNKFNYKKTHLTYKINLPPPLVGSDLIETVLTVRVIN